MNREAMRETLRVTKALSDLQRVRILMLLRGGELCVCQIVEVLALAPSTISKHLSLLSAAGLVDWRKSRKRSVGGKENGTRRRGAGRWTRRRKFCSCARATPATGAVAGRGRFSTE